MTSKTSQFSEQETVNLTIAVVTINAWNRNAISFWQEAGTYQPAIAPVTEVECRLVMIFPRKKEVTDDTYQCKSSIH